MKKQLARKIVAALEVEGYEARINENYSGLSINQRGSTIGVYTDANPMQVLCAVISNSLLFKDVTVCKELRNDQFGYAYIIY